HHLGVHDAKARLYTRIAAGRVVDPTAYGLVLERAAQLVRGDTMDRIVRGALPQRLLIVLRLQRRIGVIDLAIGTLVVICRIDEVLVQRLAVDRQTLAARLGDGGNPGAGGNVHHIESGAGHASREPQDAAKAQVLR